LAFEPEVAGFASNPPEILMNRRHMNTGNLLSRTTLPFAGTATLTACERNGRQRVVIAAGGRRVQPTGGVYAAFALPEGTTR
jgi:glucose dehydrogenase